MAGLGDRVDAVARLEAGPGRVVILPAASGTLAGSGLLSLDRAVCEPLTPPDALSIDPDPDLPIWERLVKVYTRLWDEVDARSALDLVAAGLTYHATMASVVTDEVKREQYLSAVGQAYSDYVRDYALDYVTLLKSVWDYVVKSTGCGGAALDFSAESVLGMVDGVELDFDAMKTGLTAECAVLLEMIDAFGLLYAWDQTLRDHTLEVVGAALELMGELWVVAVEKLVDTEIVGHLKEHAGDHVAIGEIQGSLLGVIMAEFVIDELLTLGAGKATRFIRFVRKVQ